MLGFHRVACAYALQQFGREGRDAGETQRLALGQRIADAQLAVVRNPDDVAGPGLVGQFTVRGQEQHRIGHGHGFLRAHMGQLHAAFEMTRCKANEGNPVAMPGVHVGLDLEHETGQGSLIRFHRPLIGRSAAVIDAFAPSQTIKG